MKNRAQGSVEYLMMISAVIAIAVIVVVLATLFYVGYERPSHIAQDMSSCATRRIQLIDYHNRFENLPKARNNLNVKYNDGTTKGCNRSTPIEDPVSTCEIVKASDSRTCFEISVNEVPSWRGCYLREVPCSD